MNRTNLSRIVFVSNVMLKVVSSVRTMIRSSAMFVKSIYSLQEISYLVSLDVNQIIVAYVQTIEMMYARNVKVNFIYQKMEHVCDAIKIFVVNVQILVRQSAQYV